MYSKSPPLEGRIWTQNGVNGKLEIQQVLSSYSENTEVIQLLDWSFPPCQGPLGPKVGQKGDCVDFNL